MWSVGRLSTWQLECGDSLESFSRQSSKVLTHLGYQVPPEADEVQDPDFASSPGGYVLDVHVGTRVLRERLGPFLAYSAWRWVFF